MNKKALLPGVFVPLMLGVTALTNTLGRPSMANARNLDVVTLVAAGALFGVALASLVAIIRRRF